MVFIEIDSVVNDVQPVGLDVEKPLDVFLCLAGNSDNGIGHFERGAFEPDRKIIATAKLFAFPRPKRLQRMNRDDKRQPVIHFAPGFRRNGCTRCGNAQSGIDVRRC